MVTPVRKRRSLVLCLDAEPRRRRPDPGEPEAWDSLKELAELLESLRPRLESATGSSLRVCWFLRLDPQIEKVYGAPTWPAETYRALFDAGRRRGDEIGIHVHAWRWHQEDGEWFADYGDQTWVEHCIQTSVGAYREVFGTTPASFRFGDSWMNNRTLALLEELGIRYDLTLEPGVKDVPGLALGERATGVGVEYVATPTEPYRPSFDDFKRPGGLKRRKIWLVPVSTGCINGEVIPRAPDPADDYMTLNLSFDHDMVRHIFNILIDDSRRPIVMVGRTGDFGHPKLRARIEANLNALAENPRLARVSFDTPAQLVRKHGTLLRYWPSR